MKSLIAISYFDRTRPAFHPQEYGKLVWLSSSVRTSVIVLITCAVFTGTASAQTLENELLRTPLADLAELARQEGDPVRGAVVFFQQQMACSKCHAVGKEKVHFLGPDLTSIEKEVSDEFLVESVLLPSKVIRKGFESVTVLTTDGKSISAVLIEHATNKLVLRDIARAGEVIEIPESEIEAVKANSTSVMPPGQINQLNSRQQFYDLIKYLIEIRDGGAARAMELQPAASLLTFIVPEYEQHLDHAGLIRTWNKDSLQRGEAIYQRVCANCHGTKDKPGSLPTSLRFAEGKFKNGSDPLSLYRTMTFGFGLMAPQSWMVPSQKYDVIHYIRETYLKPHNQGQYVAVSESYLANLPKGDTLGPEPSKIVPWSAMDYGPSLTHTYEVPGLQHNFAYKGVAVRLDPGSGGVSRGRHWMMFDEDTLRVAAAWNSRGEQDENFIDWQGIQFNGQHGVHPHLTGQVAFANSTGSGWANPVSNEFLDDQRVQGRDGKLYGPLPPNWAKYRGLYHYGQQVVFSYTVGETEVLESPGLLTSDSSQAAPIFLRTFNIGPRMRDLLLQVADYPSQNAKLSVVSDADESVVMLSASEHKENNALEQSVRFNGSTFLELTKDNSIDLTKQDFTIIARLRTKSDGTIWALTKPGPRWIPDGQTFFIRNGRLCFDIGWVGAVSAKSKITDGRWHQVAVTWEQSTNALRLFVDGKLDGEGSLAAKAALNESVVRIGFTSPDFPRPNSFFQGDIEEVRFYQSRLTHGLKEFSKPKDEDNSLVARWVLSEASGIQIADATGQHHDMELRHGAAPVSSLSSPLVAGFAPRNTAAQWTTARGHLRLKIPAGKTPLRFTIWLPSDSSNVQNSDSNEYANRLADLPIANADRDLTPLTKGGPARWPQRLESHAVLGSDDGPFAIDVLTAPEPNPWLAQTRFTGLDFFRDGRIAVCTWDGDVWVVEALPVSPTDNEPANEQTLRWQRIASGMFQPLGLKILNEKIYLTCRDQLVILHDLNNDGETDFYQCLNNDHQVTEHFHEFAMGLQTDADGNFYYAKSARHALPALVPHHGTLLKVTKDGSSTTILANGFRAANGVCLNPDGSFFVTDQEGHWNPKNRINWVTVDASQKPKFYGNMLGYHDVTDDSDAAMVPPLCWITNAFDRSPSELLWVESDRWGPLQGSLLNLSYGYGKVFLVPHEKVHGKMQGGMVELPIPSFPTGVMRGRFHPKDRQLYLCGMFAWAGNATQPGGLYRLRATGKSMNLPIELHASRSGLQLTFTEPLDPASIDLRGFHIKAWSLKRTAGYGSKHYDEMPLEVHGARLSDDSKTLLLEIPELRPTWCMEIKYSLRSASDIPFHGTIHNTIHELAD